MIKFSHCTRSQSDCLGRTVRRFYGEYVIDEIEVNLKESIIVGNGGGCKSIRGDVQRHIPPVILKRTEFEPDFADDLGPHV